MYKYIYIYTYIMYMYMCTYAYVCMYVYLYTYVYMFMYLYMYKYIYIYIFVRIYLHTHIYGIPSVTGAFAISKWGLNCSLLPGSHCWLLPSLAFALRWGAGGSVSRLLMKVKQRTSGLVGFGIATT